MCSSARLVCRAHWPFISATSKTRISAARLGLGMHIASSSALSSTARSSTPDQGVVNPDLSRPLPSFPSASTLHLSLSLSSSSEGLPGIAPKIGAEDIITMNTRAVGHQSSEALRPSTIDIDGLARKCYFFCLTDWHLLKIVFNVIHARSLGRIGSLQVQTAEDASPMLGSDGIAETNSETPPASSISTSSMLSGDLDLADGSMHPDEDILLLPVAFTMTIKDMAGTSAPRSS